MHLLVLIVKGAAVASLLILVWAAFATRRDSAAAGDSGAPDAAAGPRPDPIGRRVMQGFTAMLVVGATAMVAISLLDMADHI